VEVEGPDPPVVEQHVEDDLVLAVRADPLVVDVDGGDGHA
jgi:hypothetical protein